jgi:hypothetical protein
MIFKGLKYFMDFSASAWVYSGALGGSPRLLFYFINVLYIFFCTYPLSEAYTCTVAGNRGTVNRPLNPCF